MRKQIIILILSLLTLTVYGQKTIVNPKIVLDTVYDGYHYQFSWIGNTRLYMSDSISTYSQFTNSITYDKNYIDLESSLFTVEFKLQMWKEFGAGIGDTLTRYDQLSIPFIDLWKPMNDLYTSNRLRGVFSKSFKPYYKKKLKDY